MFYLFLGLMLGFSNGISPGPTLTLVISQTIRHGWKEGVKIAVSPLLFGIIVIPVFILFFSHIEQFNLIIPIIALIGSIYLFKLSFSHFMRAAHHMWEKNSILNPSSIKTGILVNFLSIQAYIYWLTVGMPIILHASHTKNSFLNISCFLLGYYFCLVGIKILIALFTEKSKVLMKPTVQRYLMIIIGGILFVFASSFLIYALNYFWHFFVR